MPSTNKITLIKQLVEAASNNLITANQLLNDVAGTPTTSGGKKILPPTSNEEGGGGIQRTEQGAVIIEGVFDGQNMVGPDGKMYSVPANYASKSKLVEGDLLKLTISANGSFIYKQIGPVDRDRLMGVLVKDEESEDFRVLCQGRYYKLLLASVTYFKGELGDEIVILVPKNTTSTWAAVENVIKAGQEAPILENSSTDTLETTSKAPLKKTTKTAVKNGLKVKVGELKAEKIEI
ncbi:hypothetical protein KKC17_03765 [Patescibacteria group bacterium]|nr:hypothetical protein [Patescibacteria group bacterium]